LKYVDVITNVSTGISPAQAPPKSGYTSVSLNRKLRTR